MNPHGFLRVVQRVLSKMGNSSLISMMKEVYKEPIYIYLSIIYFLKSLHCANCNNL